MRKVAGIICCKAADANKDQTYFLNQVTQEQLEKVLVPARQADKSRRCVPLRKSYGLSTAQKEGQHGHLLHRREKFPQFSEKLSPRPARPQFVTRDGKEVVGEHIGLMYYTLGQSEGPRHLGGQKGDAGEGRWFVTEKDLKNNILYVSHGDESELFTRSCTVSGINWIPSAPKEEEFACTAKFRYRQSEQGVRVRKTGENSARVDFEKPQRAVTPGQYAVFYDGERCIGGGVID